MYNELDVTGVSSVEYLSDILAKYNVQKVLIKKLAKNNNDKNQVYFHHDASLLNSVFDLEFSTRTKSTSSKNAGKHAGKLILEARFNDFNWLSVSGDLHQVNHCKGILYHQYPEVRLSGFKSVSGLMPHSMSVDFTKKFTDRARYLAIGATSEGQAIAVMVTEPEVEFENDFRSLPFFSDSKICRCFSIESGSGSSRLRTLLVEHVGGKTVKGCRLKPNGETVPFTGTQVHGYTLEHELGISSNSDKEGDIFGIELKCFTSNKLTLFTPEPDGGLYHQCFEEFMVRYGYAKEAVYRFTGLHRVGKISEKTDLSLEVVCIHKGQESTGLQSYDLDKPLSHQMEGLQVILKDDEGLIAASWSVDRLLNNWGVKHNEVVYVPATVSENKNLDQFKLGFTKQVEFGESVLWCKRTSLEKMIQAIASGVIFLDPAPKYDPDNPRNSKRRSQWRINNIYRDSASLYESVDFVSII